MQGFHVAYVFKARVAGEEGLQAHVPVLAAAQDTVTALREAHEAAPRLLQLGVLRGACAHQHLQALHAEAPAAARVATEQQLAALTAHRAIGLVAVVVIHVEELEEAVPARLAEPPLKERMEGHGVFPTTGETAIFQVTLVVANIQSHLFSTLVLLSSVFAIVVAVGL